MLSLVYVSCPSVEPDVRSEALDDIQAVSIARNTELEITGLLITTSDYFAQLLEGPAPGVDAVMARIVADPRHYDIRIIRRSELAARRHPQWRMARFDGERFGGAGVNALLAACHADDDPIANARLDRLIESIALTSMPARP